MKHKLTLILYFIAIRTTNAQELDNKTKNKIKAMFFMAQDQFKDGNYDYVLTKVDEISTLMGSKKNPTALALKIKALVEKNDYLEAEKQYEILQELNLSTKILKEITPFAVRIEKGIEEQNRKKKEEELRKKLEEEEKEKRRIALSEAPKHFEYVSCSAEGCNDGKTEYKYDKMCRDCYGKGKVYKANILGGILNGMTNTNTNSRGRYVSCSNCGGDGKLTYKDTKTCGVCVGSSKVLNYTGDYNFSDKEIKGVINSNRYEINSFITKRKEKEKKLTFVRQRFNANPNLTFIPSKNRDGKVGFYNRDLEAIIGFEYDKAELLDIDKAIVVKDRKYGVINNNKETLIPIIYNKIVKYENKLALYKGAEVFESNIDGTSIVDAKESSFIPKSTYLYVTTLNDSELDDIVLRSNPKATGEEILKCSKDSKVYVISKLGSGSDYYMVKVSGVTGFLPRSILKKK